MIDNQSGQPGSLGPHFGQAGGRQMIFCDQKSFNFFGEKNKLAEPEVWGSGAAFRLL